MATIPPDLLHAVSLPNQGRVSLVIGAGCSIEKPTSIPSASRLADDARKALVRDGTIAETECPEPCSLPALTSVVFQKLGTQAPLVSKLPMDKMRVARPNDGHKVLVALMIEGAVAHVLSLNFDLAVQNAAAELGVEIHSVTAAGAAVPATPTLVYLHGCATGDSEHLILRTEALDEAWKASWVQVVAGQVLASPNVLFVGLGSPAPVLSETVQMIVTAVGNNKTFYQADISAFSDNGFAQQLGLSEGNYILGRWSEVMSSLARRLVEDQVDRLVEDGSAVLAEDGAGESDIDSFSAQAETLRQVSLLTLGHFRAISRLSETTKYVRHSQDDDEWMAKPLLVLHRISSSAHLTALPAPNGVWMLRGESGYPKSSALTVTGRGVKKLAALEPAIRAVCLAAASSSGTAPELVIVGGVVAGAPPSYGWNDIVDSDAANEEDIVAGLPPPRIVPCEDPSAILAAEAWLNVA